MEKVELMKVEGFMDYVDSPKRERGLKSDLLDELMSNLEVAYLEKRPISRKEFIKDMLICTDGSYTKSDIMEDAKKLRNFKVTVTFEEVETKDF